MKIIELQEKVLSLQSKLSTTNNINKYELNNRLRKFYNTLDTISPEEDAKEWQILATLHWEDIINKL